MLDTIDKRVTDVPVREQGLVLSISDVAVAVLLLFTMLLAGYFRFTGTNWDDYVHFHPDERFFTLILAPQIGRDYLTFSDGNEAEQEAHCREAYPDTNGVGGYFDARCSTMNPHNIGSGHYAYGTMPLFVTRWTIDFLNSFRDDVYFNRYEVVPVVWRTLSAVWDTITVLIVFFIGVRLHGKWTGLLAAFLYACSVFPIQLAHFGTVDSMAVMWVALTLYFSLGIQRNGSYVDYIGAGVAFGATLASRFNLAPLVVVILAASAVQMLPLLDSRLAWSERARAFSYHFGGLVLAGFLTLLIFRLFNPYAFLGPGFFGILPNTRWLEDLASARRETSMDNDGPPHWQWVGRPQFFFAWWNMVMWGMGLALGLTGWIATFVAAWQIVRRRAHALYTAPLVAWILVYFAFAGGNFVMSMRYYTSLYPALAVLAAWGLIELSKRAFQRPFKPVRRLASVGVLAFVPAFTLIWAGMFTNIYRHQATFVQASHWVWEESSGDFSMRVMDSAAPLLEIQLDSETAALLNPGGVVRGEFTAPVDGVIHNLQTASIGAFVNTGGLSRVRLTVHDASGATLAESTFEGGFPATTSYTFTLTNPLQLRAGENYETRIELVSGTTLTVSPKVSALVDTGESILDETDLTDAPLVVIPYYNNGRVPNDQHLNGATTHTPNQPTTQSFVIPADGVIDRVYAPRIMSQNQSSTVSALRISIAREGQAETIQTILTDTFTPDSANPLGKEYTIPLTEPLQVRQGERYNFTTEVVYGDPLITVGSTYAWEGAWDEGMPAKVCTLPVGTTLADDPPPGLLSPDDCKSRSPWDHLFGQYSLDLYRDDNIIKRDELVHMLERSDYIIIGTNRRYDSQARIPSRWPLTNRYYDALFSGELGFEQVALFQETFELGPLRVSDQHLPTYNSPAWLNEFEAEEAFHVYDHPAVFIYKKGEDFSAERVKEILYSVPMNPPALGGTLPHAYPVIGNLVHWSTGKADEAPTTIQFSDEMRAIQYNNGTWSERFDRSSAINTNQVLAVVGWYGAMMLFGLIAFPLLFISMPALADRGYGFSKFAGMFFVSWLAWLGGSARLATWSPEGVRLITLILAVISLMIAFRVRDRLVPYVRQRWRLLLTIEVITVVLYLVFIGVRLTAPDLWTTGYGGEKPMDFAYLNGVLRSTIFPPIDPWFANGYLNYYYFGFVIVGTPTLFLGVVPSLAYNLILPMLFAMTGIGAFSAAFSIVNALQERQNALDVEQPRRLGNPYIAGVAALMMAVVFGNLDTPRVFATGLANLGGYETSRGLQEFLIEEYRAEHGGADPIGAEYDAIVARAQTDALDDRLRYELSHSAELVSSVARGFGRLLAGEQLPVAPNRWFWAPTRVLTETPGVEGNAINEMPAFTFIYGDLHGHMIAMPLMLLIIGFVFSEVMLAGREQRRLGAKTLALLIGGLAVGMTYTVNSWDYPTFMVFTILGLGYGWWLSWRRVTREALFTLAVRLIGFALITYLVALPYRTWFASGYNSIKAWDGGKSPLWAYFDIHGLFLFFVVSLLIWETARWLRATRVRDLRGQLALLVVGFIGLVLVVAVSIIAAIRDYQVALVVLPLVVWIAALFFRPGQTAPMQFTLVLIGLALSITLGVEVIVLEGDIGRQNTVFKFYIQVWLLFSVACGAVVAWLLQNSDHWRGWVRVPWYAVATVLVFIAALFPIMAVRGKAVHRLSDQIPVSLDGAEFIRYSNYWEEQTVDMAADDRVIRWLQDNIEGSPVIIEAMSRGEYQWGGRISIHTGLPTVLGWNWHQRQQRSIEKLPDLVWQRVHNVNSVYITTDLNEAWRILDYFGVEYIVVAGLERALYPPEGLAKFDEMVSRGWLEIAYQEGSATIYRVNQGANPAAYLAMGQ